jgi:hypothetical protein
MKLALVIHREERGIRKSRGYRREPETWVAMVGEFDCTFAHWITMQAKSSNKRCDWRGRDELEYKTVKHENSENRASQSRAFWNSWRGRGGPIIRYLDRILSAQIKPRTYTTKSVRR